jgi:hypothetical protein
VSSLQQFKLYQGMLRLGRAYGTGGAAWTGVGVRTPTVGLAAPTLSALASATGYFLENNRIREAMSLPQVAIYTAPWWWITGIDTDVQAGDIRTNGTRAFVITGTPDTSQEIFQVCPATVFQGAVPSVGGAGLVGQPMGLLVAITYAA